LVAAVLVVAGCADGDDEAAPTEPPPATTTTATTTESTEPLDDFVTGPVVAEAEGEEIALVERVALGRHDGYDRVVFQFRNDLPGYRIEYVEPPLREDGSGAPVKIEGHAFAVVRMEPASGFDVATGEGELVYDGPRRIAGSGIVAELVRTGDFEAVLTWSIGLHERAPFRVLRLENPARLVVDFRSG
jgi:hypothetical protein